MAASTVKPEDVLRKCRVIAVVGASKNPEKEAFSVPEYLRAHGYTVIPINPTAEVVQGTKAYPALGDIPLGVARTVEVVEVFRPSEELAQIASQVAEMKRRTGRPLVFWAQLGLESEQAKQILRNEGIDFVMDACMRTVHREELGGG